MCGINGFFSFTNINEDDIKNVAKMADNMRYRGPDDIGYYNDDKIALSHVRLSIIGLSSGKQPIFNEDGSLVIIFNGEIYNYKELKEQLIKKGHVFKTETDTEVIIHLFEDKKEKCLDDLRGMYAIAIYDIINKQLFIARDVVGKKPLYYTQTPKGFAFSSEVTAIKDNIANKYDVDVEEIKTHLKHSYAQSLSKTYISQIKKLEAGQYAYIDDAGISLKRYWKKKNTCNYQGSYEEAKNKTLELLSESVELRLRSDVPIAILLSGGIDSSAVLALATQNHKNIHAITVGYKGAPSNDERDVAKRFAKERGAIWHEIELSEDDFIDYFNEYIDYIDEPNADMASIPLYSIYKKAREMGFTVLLTGNGGDEVFYGYREHNIDALNIKTVNELNNRKRKIRHYLKYLIANFKKIRKFVKTYNLKPYKNFYHCYYDSFKYKFDDEYTFSQTNYMEKYFNDEIYEIDGMYSYLFNVWLVNNSNFHFDKLAMANSVETRSPLQDRKLIEFVSSLPIEYKFHENNPKGFLKDTLRGLVPDYILDAPKRGFSPGNAADKLIANYKPKYFNTKCTGYPEVVMDKFLSDKLKV